MCERVTVRERERERELERRTYSKGREREGGVKERERCLESERDVMCVRERGYQWWLFVLTCINMSVCKREREREKLV